MAGWHISRWKHLRSAEQVDMFKDFFIPSPCPLILLSDLSPIQIQGDVKQEQGKQVLWTQGQ